MKEFFFSQTFICTGYEQLSKRIEEYVNQQKKEGYIFKNYNLINTLKCDESWQKYQIIFTFER